MSQLKKQTNLQCVSSDSVGRYCIALNEIDQGCLAGECPFYKTEYQQKMGEARAKARCLALGINFKSRDRVIRDMSKVSDIRSSYYTRKTKSEKGVIQFRPSTQEYIEYDSVEDACNALDLSELKLDLLIKKGEKYNGYKFTYL